VQDVPELLVLNKADAASPEVVARVRRREGAHRTVVVSARTGEGMAELEQRIAEGLPRPQESVDVVVPYDRGDLVHRVHEEGEVEAEEHTAAGTVLRARVDADLAAELRAVSA